MPTDSFQIWELYEFQLGSEIYRFTSNAVEKVVGADLYGPFALKRTSVASTMEEARNALTITASADFEVADLYYAVAPTETVLVRVKRHNEGGLATTDLIWSGRLLNCEWNEEGEVEMQCEPVTISVGRSGLFRRYNRQCPYALYSAATCKVARASYEQATVVSLISGATLEVAALNTAYSYSGGFVEWQTATHVERRFIEKQEGTSLILLQPFSGIAVGNSVTVLPGCERTTTACNDIFNNLPNYGGFPYMQTTNVFATGLDLTGSGSSSFLSSYLDQAHIPNVPLRSISFGP